MTYMGVKMVKTLKSTAQDTDQKTVVKTSKAMFEVFTNVLEVGTNIALSLNPVGGPLRISKSHLGVQSLLFWSLNLSILQQTPNCQTHFSVCTF